jgi:hypothetical protein
MLSLQQLSLSYAPAAALTTPRTVPRSFPKMETVADLESLATKLNPTVGFYDPLGLAQSGMGAAGTLASEEAVIGFLRAAEIKHGRVAMAAFVGFIVQSNGIHFPWDLTTSGISHADIAAAGGPAAQWDALPTASKMQIFGAIGFLEGWGENAKAIEAQGQKHYMRGGKPGFFPSFQVTSGSKPAIHPLPLDLFDPFGLSKKASPEKKAKGLLAEINNGRLAMLGIIAFMAEARVPGAVPGLVGKVTPYSGECMAPFAAGDVSLPFVSEMLKYTLPNVI